MHIYKYKGSFITAICSSATAFWGFLPRLKGGAIYHKGGVGHMMSSLAVLLLEA